MAPIKFEEQLREKLEKRTIQPSSEAWSTLSNRLDQLDKKQSHRTYWWLGIAASIVGVVLVTSFIFNSSKTTTISPVIVDTPIKSEVNSNTIASEEVEVLKAETLVNTKPEATTKSIEQPKIKDSKGVSPIKEMIVNEAVASNDSKDEIQIEKAEEKVISNSDFEQAKLNDVVAEINKLKAQYTDVSEAQLDSLLKQAEREILTNKIYNEKTRTVDANALLQDVETDLEQSFRTRVFEALLNNYESVKTAVANRNN